MINKIKEKVKELYAKEKRYFEFVIDNILLFVTRNNLYQLQGGTKANSSIICTSLDSNVVDVISYHLHYYFKKQKEYEKNKRKITDISSLISFDLFCFKLSEVSKLHINDLMERNDLSFDDIDKAIKLALESLDINTSLSFELSYLDSDENERIVLYEK